MFDGDLFGFELLYFVLLGSGILIISKLISLVRV